MRIFSLILIVLSIFIPIALPASIIKKPPAPAVAVDPTFSELVCTDADHANIYEIITTLANNGKISLLLKQNHLNQLGAQINHVHPLKFLGVVFADPTMKAGMYYVFDDYFKRNGFLDGLGPSLDREMQKGKLAQYINDFAAYVNVPAENIIGYFEAMDWEGLVRHLIAS